MPAVLQQKRQVFQISKRFSQLFIPKSAETLIDDQQKNCSNHGKGISEDGRGIAQWGGTEAHLNTSYQFISFVKEQRKLKIITSLEYINLDRLHKTVHLSHNRPQAAEFHRCRVATFLQP